MRKADASIGEEFAIEISEDDFEDLNSYAVILAYVQSRM